MICTFSSGHSSSISCSSRSGRRHHGQRASNHHSNLSEELTDAVTVEPAAETSASRSERMGGTVASK